MLWQREMWHVNLFVGLFLFNDGLAQYLPDEKINIVSEHGEVLLKTGEKKDIYCISDEPGLKWERPDGSAVGGRSPTRRVHVEEVPGQLVLVFSDPQLEDDGVWYCRTRTMHRRIVVHVVEEAVFEPGVKVLTPLADQELSLSCTAHGMPPPRLAWYRNGEEMKDTHNPGKMEVWPGRLKIHRVVYSDAGDYECRATQTRPYWNHTASQTTTVRVRHAPVMLMGQRHRVWVLYDQVHVLRCSVEAFPRARYKWLRRTIRGEHTIPMYSGDISIASNGSYSELTVRVNGQDDLGDYLCRATNAHGTNFTVFHLLKGTRPPTPSKVVYNSSKSDALLFAVECSECAPPTNTTHDADQEVEETPPEPREDPGWRFELVRQKLSGPHRDVLPVYWERSDTAVLRRDIERNENGVVAVGRLEPETTYVVRAAKLGLAGTSEFVEVSAGDQLLQCTTLKASAHHRHPLSWPLMVILATLKMFT